LRLPIKLLALLGEFFIKIEFVVKVIFRSVFTISFFTAISRIFGFIRDILIARYLGVSMMSDVFFAAFRLPNFFRRIFAEGAFNSAFIPIFVAENKKSGIQSKEFILNIFSILLYILLVFVMILQIFMPFFMKILFPGFYDDSLKFDLLIEISRITIFYLIFISLVSLLSGILNSLSKFAIPAATPIILNLTLIISIFAISPFVPNYAYALSWGVFVAGCLQFLVLFYATAKLGFLAYPKIPSINSSVKKFFKKIIPAIVGANVMQINLLVDSIFASMTIGAISYLYYADRINQLPLALIGIAIGVVLLPKLSSLIKDKKEIQAIRLQNITIKIALLLSIPASLGLIILSYDIIYILFERGNFTNSETICVSKALILYAIALPAFILVKVLEPSFFARGNTKIPMQIAIICVIVNALLNLIFYHLNFGYLGIILAAIIASYLNLAMILKNLITKKYFWFIDFSFISFLKLSLPSAIMSLFLILLKKISIFITINPILMLIFQIMVGLAIYLILLWAFGYAKILKPSQMLED